METAFGWLHKGGQAAGGCLSTVRETVFGYGEAPNAAKTQAKRSTNLSAHPSQQIEFQLHTTTKPKLRLK